MPVRFTAVDVDPDIIWADVDGDHEYLEPPR
jgi:hypothetical protein